MQPTRRSYSKSFKAKVIQECARPGASIANIALEGSAISRALDYSQKRWVAAETT